jgi:hypothetical protein
MNLAALLPEARPAYAIPPGFGFHRLNGPELAEQPNLFDTLQMWERPRKGHRYILGCDVSDGLGQDRSVCDVLRMGTIEEPEEQVAQFVSETCTPKAFAYIIQAIGTLYKWPDGQEAMAAIECNNHGLSVQDTLQLHLGYRHFYIWEVLDQADPQKRFTTRMGWMTTPRTRPILLDQFHNGIVGVDPLSGYSDLRINSTLTIDELRDFQTEGALWEAEAGRGAHDDCIIALAIAHFVAYRLMAGEREPLDDRRKRRREEKLRAAKYGDGKRPDYRNTDVTADDAKLVATPQDALGIEEDEDEHWYYDPSGRSWGGTLYD